jgi:hypothetical protein
MGQAALDDIRNWLAGSTPIARFQPPNLPRRSSTYASAGRHTASSSSSSSPAVSTWRVRFFDLPAERVLKVLESFLFGPICVAKAPRCANPL